MIVGDFCLKETPNSEVALRWLPLWEFSGTMAAAFYNWTKFTIFIHLLDYFFSTFTTKHSLFLLLFRVNGASERSAIPTTKRHWALATRWSSLRSKSTGYYPSRVILRNSPLLDVNLSFSVKTQITAGKQTRLVIHSFKRKARTLYEWSLGISPVLAQLRGVTSSIFLCSH